MGLQRIELRWFGLEVTDEDTGKSRSNTCSFFFVGGVCFIKEIIGI